MYVSKTRFVVPSDAHGRLAGPVSHWSSRTSRLPRELPISRKYAYGGGQGEGEGYVEPQSVYHFLLSEHNIISLIKGKGLIIM